MRAWVESTMETDGSEWVEGFWGTPAPAGALYEAIKHGDAAHRDWLRKAVDAFYAGEPIPRIAPAASEPAQALQDAERFWRETRDPEVSPMSRWPFEQPHVARDLLARLYATMGEPRDAKLEAEIDVFLAATRRP